MQHHVKKANKLKIETIIKNLARRNMIGHYCESREEACELALSLIEDKSVVSWGGSVTLDETGIKTLLAERDVTLIDPYGTKDPAESLERRRQQLFADVVLMSSNAITMDGELVNIDGTSNRVASLCFGPKKVILIVGANKISTDVESAIKRAKLDAAVPNNVRLKKNNPCTITGECSNCLSKECICCNTVITRFNSTPGRIVVILVNENLGF